MSAEECVTRITDQGARHGQPVPDAEVYGRFTISDDLMMMVGFTRLES